MLALFTESLSNASFGIYFPKFTGTIYELLSAPVSYVKSSLLCRCRRVQIGGVGIGHPRDRIAVRAIKILHPVWMIAFC